MDSKDLKAPAVKRSNARSVYAHPVPLPLPISLISYIAGLLPGLPDSAYIRELPLGIYDELSGSVRVEEAEGMMVLWRRGFFGKGSLSRSEPTWLARERNRRGLSKELTAEEITAKRRIERRAAKIAKAKEKLAGMTAETTADVEAIVEQVAPPIEAAEPVDPIIAGDIEVPPAHVLDDEPVVNMEHLQLQREEAFFLQWAIGSLRVRSEESTEPLSILDAWSRYLRPPFHSFPDADLRPDNPFLVSYVVYHHFRSLGWVVRNGIKFCVDWVLYKGADGSGKVGGVGPVGGHAEFAILVFKHYEDENERPKEEVEDQEGGNETRRDWRFINTVNRVCSGVKKTLVLVYVTVPSRKRCPPELIAAGPQACLQLYTVREILVRRFVPTRLRD